MEYVWAIITGWVGRCGAYVFRIGLAKQLNQSTFEIELSLIHQIGKLLNLVLLTALLSALYILWLSEGLDDSPWWSAIAFVCFPLVARSTGSIIRS